MGINYSKTKGATETAENKEPQKHEENKAPQKPVDNPPTKPDPPAITENYIYRCAVLGIAGVGKSSLIERFVNGKFNENSLPKTDSALYLTKDGIQNGSKNIKLHITDTPGTVNGMPTSSTLSRLSFVLLVFDVTNKESFEALENYVETFNFKNSNPVKKLIIVGNKADEGEPRKVDP